jgi:signal transduction histidine kinase
MIKNNKKNYLLNSLVKKFFVISLVIIVIISLLGFIFLNNQRDIISHNITNQIDFMNSITKIYVFFILLLFLLIIYISFFIYLIITKPIKEIHNAINEVKNNNLSIRTNIKTGDELEDLGIAFNEMVNQIEKLDYEQKQIEIAKTDFLSITSHELRSPITPMKAQLQMLLKNYFGLLNYRQRYSLDMILRNTKKLDKIIQDILDISRMETARLKFNFIKVNLKKDIIMLVDSMNALKVNKNIIINLKIEKLPIIETDPDRIMQVLRNILINAIKFSNKNGIIKLNVKSEKKHILFRIEDNGVGISKENLDKIFEPFFQEEYVLERKHEGVGLGLSLCKGIVESQNGKIWVKSEKGIGSIFYFTIPFKPVKDIKPIKIMFSKNK